MSGLKKHKNLIWIICITALAICLGCVFAACSTAQAESVRQPAAAANTSLYAPALTKESPTGEAAAQNYSRWLSDHYSTKVYTHEMWLSDLMDGLGITLTDKNDRQMIYAAAHKNGIADSASEQPYAALTRRYAAETLQKALHYKTHTVSGVKDLDDADTAMNTLVYYGWFIPDEEDCVYPDAAITVDEYHQLLEEVDRYRRMKGKTLLAFGDSIMFGKGNSSSGIADLIAEKYGMHSIDYSVSGATFGVYKTRSHIADQIRSAAEMGIEPDIILINGGTNDMSHVKLGKLTSGYDADSYNENTFAGGFETAASLLQQYWEDIPVVYIRAHNMATVEDEKEQQFGDLAIDIAEKWYLFSVDIYNDSEFCTEQIEMRDAYTMFNKKFGACDGIHPTALGYAKYYLPIISDEIGAILNR